jgi:hypothetical protein
VAYEEASLDATTSARVDIFMREAALGCVSMFGKQTDFAKARIMSGPGMLSRNVSLWPEFSLRVGYSSHGDLEYKSSWGESISLFTNGKKS